jgi:hypothetical protein
VIARMDDEDKPPPAGYQRVLVVGVGATVGRTIVELMVNSTYVTAEVDPIPKSNIFETKYNRQREWWNTPKKERRRKK